MSSRLFAMVLTRVLLLAGASLALHSQQQFLQTGTITIQVINWHGRTLPSYGLTISALSGQKPYRKELTGPGLRTLQLSYGKYRVRASASLHDGAETEFTVNSVRSHLVVSLPPAKWGESADRYSDLVGKVSGQRAEPQNLTVRIVCLFAAYIRHEPVRSDATFEITGVPDGEYLLLLLEGSKILRELRVSKTPQLAEVNVALTR